VPVSPGVAARLIEALESLGDWDVAGSYIIEGIDYCRRTGDPYGIEFRWILGRALANQGNVRGGIETMERAVADAEREADRDPVRRHILGVGLSNLASAVLSFGHDSRRAVDLFERAVEVGRDEGYDYGVAIRLWLMADPLLRMGGQRELELALRHTREAVAIYEERLDRPDREAEARMQLATIHFARNEPEVGSREFELAATIYGKRGRIKRLSKSLLTISRAPNLSPGQQARYLRRAAETAATACDPVSEAWAMLSLARVRRSVGMDSGAAEYHRFGIRIVESARTGLSRGIDRASLLEVGATLYSDAALLAARRSEPHLAFRYAEAGRARWALDQQSEIGTKLIADPQLRDRRKRLAAEIGDLVLRLEGVGLERLLETDADGSNAAERVRIVETLDRLEAEWRELELALTDGNARLAARVPTTTDSVWTASKVQGELLGADSVLLEYLVGENGSLLFAITDTKFKVFDLGIDAATLKRMVSETCAAFVDVDRGYPYGHALYRTLVKPAEDLIGDRSEILISPDGPLHQLPFAALLREDPTTDGEGEAPRFGHRWASLPYFLDDSINIRYIASATTNGALRRAEAAEPLPDRQLLAFGAPLDSVDATTAARFPPLRFALTELTAISNGFEAAEVTAVPCLGDDRAATKEAVLSLVEGPKRARLVHFATHGVVDNRSPWLSALVLDPDDGNGHEPGYLRANEAVDLTLPADCVTMSGCHTLGSTFLSGEGVIGLALAFRHAGARNVCASFWEVQDQSTAELMECFYAGLAAGGDSPAAALANAQRTLISKGYHPNRWAAFAVFG